MAFGKESIPEVNFAIIRLDFQTKEIKCYCELEQPFRKTLPEEGYRVIGENYILIVPPIDFGYTQIISGLTGQKIYRASTIWMGMGKQEFPPEEWFRQDFSYEFDNPYPDSIYSLFDYGTKEGVDSVWKKVRETDMINRLPRIKNYSVLIYEHFFRVGWGGPIHQQQSG